MQPRWTQHSYPSGGRRVKCLHGKQIHKYHVALTHISAELQRVIFFDVHTDKETGWPIDVYDPEKTG